MADQPDWQRFQSSVGPPVYKQQSAAPPTISGIYVGPWKAIQISASDGDATVLWQITFTWSTDAAAAQIVKQDTILVGRLAGWSGWLAVAAPYLRVSCTATIPSGGQNLGITVLPTNLDITLIGRFIKIPVLTVQENILNHGNFNEFEPLFTVPGPAVLTCRANAYGMIYDLYQIRSDGVFTLQYRFQAALKDVAVQYQFTLPLVPIKVRVTNVELFSSVTYDVRVDLA